MLLSIQDLKVAFRMGKGVLAEAVKGVSFDVPANTTVALVGESGSGKSVTAMSILNLLPDNAERTGTITFQGRDMLDNEFRGGTAVTLEFKQKSPGSNDRVTLTRAEVQARVAQIGAAAASFAQSVLGFFLVLLSNLIVRKIDSDRALF